MNNLKKIRSQRGISLRSLSAEVGIAFSTLSEMENGIRPMAPKHAKLLAPFFRVSEEYVIGDDLLKINTPSTPTIKSYNFASDRWESIKEDVNPLNKKLSGCSPLMRKEVMRDKLDKSVTSVVNLMKNKTITPEEAAAIYVPINYVIRVLTEEILELMKEQVRTYE